MATLTQDYLIRPRLDNTAFASIQKKIIKGLTGKSAEIDIEVDESDVNNSFNKIENKAKTVGDKAGKGFGGTFASGAKKFLAGAAIFSVLAAGVSVVKDAAGEFRNFNTELANVASLGVGNIDALGNKLNDLSKKTIGSASELTAAYYQTYSAGIKGTQDDLVGFVEQASKVAVAGNATTEEAVKGLTGVLNSYGLGVESTQKVSDIFFGTIKNGVVDFGELNSSLSAVLPAASAAGIQFEEVAGNIAQMTANNVPAAQATTQLRAAIIELQKPGKTLSGVMKGVTVDIDGVSQQLTSSNIGKVLEQQGLTKTLQDIEGSASAMGLSMNQVFSSTEAAGAALLLTGDKAESANQQLQNIQQGIKDGVANDAFEAQAKSIDNQIKLVQDNIQGGFNDLFTALQPTVAGLLSNLVPLIQNIFSGLVPALVSVFNIIKPLITNGFAVLGPAISVITNTVGILATGIGYLFSAMEIGLPLIVGFSAAYALGNANLLKNIAITKTKLVWDKAVVLATKGWTIAQTALNLVLNNNPIGRVILLIGGIVTAIVWAYNNFKPFKAIVDKVWESIKKFAGAVGDAIVSVGKFLGLIDEDPPTAPIDKQKQAYDQLAFSTEDAIKKKEELANVPPPPPLIPDNDDEKKVKDTTKYVVEYFDALKDGQAELETMAKLEDEITRIQEERSKNIGDEIKEQERSIDSLLDRKLKLEQSLKDGFVIKEDGSKIQIKADEHVELEEMLDALNSDLKLESKKLTKLEITAEVDERKTKRETAATIADLQRERLEIEVDMGLKPKNSLLDAYEKDMQELNEALTDADSIEQQKLLNERLRLQKKINKIVIELNEDEAKKAAIAYQNSYRAVLDSFQNSLNDAFKISTDDNGRTESIKEELGLLDERKAEILKDYNEGKITAQQYNESLLEIEENRVKKSEELYERQLNSFKVFAVGIGNAFSAVSDQYADMANQNIAKLNELKDKENEYQLLQQAGKEIPDELATAHQEYSDAASNAMRELGISATATFASILVQGKLSAKAFLNLALSTLDSVISIYIAEIFAFAAAQLGPIAGPIAAVGAIAAVKGLVAVAKSEVGGAYKGVFNLSHSNKGAPGPGDTIPMMLKPKEAVVPSEIAMTNPYIEKAVGGMNEDEYFAKYWLPKHLAKFGISMPSMNATVIPLQINEANIKRIENEVRRIEEIDDFYNKINSENLAAAINRDNEIKNELVKQNRELKQILAQHSEDSKELRKELSKYRKHYSRNSTIQLEGNPKVKGEDIEIVLKNKRRKELA